MRLENLQKSGRLSVFFLVAAVCGFDLVFLLMRIKYSGNLGFVFLIWNLILAIIPYLAALGLHSQENPPKKRWSDILLSTMLLFIWIIFLPNAPYLITDLCHLQIHEGIGFWYDVMILMSFACTGLLLALLSLYDVHRWISCHFSASLGWLAVIAACYGSGIGIYLGRILRWNSWDIATRPGVLLSEGGHHFASLAQMELQIGFMFIMGTFLLILYSLGWHFLRVFAIREKIQDDIKKQAYWSVTF